MEEKVNILLIEDNPADSELVSIFIKGVYSNRAVLVTADTLADGIQHTHDSSFDVIILDLTLPDSWGLDTFSKLHATLPDIPVIVLTGLEDETIGTKAVKLGAQDFLLKGNIKGKDLQRSINYSIERNKLLLSLAEKTNALYFEKQKLDEAQKLAHIGSWERDLVTEKITWSNELFRIYGMKPQEEELQIDTLSKYIHPEDKTQLKDAMDNIISSSEQITFTYRIIRKDGAIRTLYSSGESIRNEKGQVTKIIGTGQDVTEKLEEEEIEKLVTAATKSFNSVIITNAAGNIEWANEGFTALTGYTLEEIKNAHVESVKKGTPPHAGENEVYYKKVVTEKKPVTYESKNYSKQKREYWTITTLTPVLDKNGKVKRIIAIDSDITLRKEMEEDLLHANQNAESSLIKANIALDELTVAKKHLEESMRIKEQFMANMSHEIRTPMNAIVGFTDLTLKTPLSEEQKQYINAIKMSGENLIVIINDILDFSKIQAGKIAVEKIEFSLGQVVSTIIDLMQPKANEKQVALLYSVEPEISDKLIGDPTRLSQILLNLVGNAIKFTKKGKVTVGVDKVFESADSAIIKFSITDTGIGIPTSKMPNIFDAFTQATYDTTRKYGGTGLGLAIVKQLVDILEGDVSVKSEVNKGSVFAVTLPYKKGLSKKSSKKSAVQEIAPAIKNLSVLLVEDNTLNQILAQKVLSNWGWEVEIAATGIVAIDKVGKQNFDVVLMDIQLPDMDGYETTRQIREKLDHPRSTIPIIAMTAHAFSGEEEKCYRSGMNGYISKPFVATNLYKKIISVLQKPEDHIDIENPQILKPTNGKYTNLDYLNELANGSDEFMSQMLHIFIDQVPGALVDIEKYAEEKNWELLSKAAHKIKASFMFMGINELEKDIKSLEKYASEKTNTDKIPQIISRIKDISGYAITELKEKIQQ